MGGREVMKGSKDNMLLHTNRKREGWKSASLSCEGKQDNTCMIGELPVWWGGRARAVGCANVW